jgi:hypothetical protein
MPKVFEKVSFKKPQKSAFDLSHDKKLSMRMGYLYPSYFQEVLPGDKFRVNSEVMIRFAPLIAPVMHRINAYIHFFFVPTRLVWNEKRWEAFITGGEDGLDSSTLPALTMNNGSKSYFLKGRLPDYLGIPPMASGTTYNYELDINALPFRAYQMIYNEYYRDEDLSSEIDFDLDDDAQTDISNLTGLRQRHWEKDYFTSSRPETQKGAEVTLPTTIDYAFPQFVYESDGETLQTLDDLQTDATGRLEGAADAILKNLDDVQITINDFRESIRLQQWMEINMRAGSRYVESNLAHWGVKSSDARIQRPEYLGGGSTPVTISEVLNTSDTANADQGNMAGHGISVGSAMGFDKFFEEHGYIFGILSVLPRSQYQDGVPKTFLHLDKFDFAWPEFARLGEQEVKLEELWLDLENIDPDDGDIFGYQQRYAEYKHNFNSTHGDMRDDLDHWHLGRILDSEPTLNTSFVKCSPDTRIFATVDGTDYLYVQVYNDVKAIRPLPYFAAPTI